MRISWQRFAALLHFLALSAQPGPPHMSGSSSPPDLSRSDTGYLRDLLEDTREELTRADSKAALLLAATGVAVGALLAGLLNGRWTPFQLDNRVAWIWWLGVGSAALGIFSIAAAVYPRIRARGAHRPAVPAYYGDVAAYEDVDSFRRAIGQSPSAEERLTDQVFQVSRIVQRKYVLLRGGLRFLFVAILACTAAVLINIPLSR